MRSRPYKPPPPLPLPPSLDDLAAYMPNSDHRQPSNESEAPLPEPNHETGRLLPRKPRQHRVLVQGRSALVRGLSVMDLKSMNRHISSPRSVHREAPLDSGVGSTVPRRHSMDDGSDTDEEISERDTQMRGYGIGGAGNIRRPTEVMGRPARSSPHLSALLSPSSVPSSPSSVNGDRKKWNIREFLGKVSDRKGKSKGSAVT